MIFRSMIPPIGNRLQKPLAIKLRGSNPCVVHRLPDIAAGNAYRVMAEGRIARTSSSVNIERKRRTWIFSVTPEPIN
jgi:hypothetical protein